MKNNKYKIGIHTMTEINMDLNKNTKYLSDIITIEKIAKRYNMDIIDEYIDIVDNSRPRNERIVSSGFVKMIKDAKNGLLDEIIVVYNPAFTQYDFDMLEYHTTEHGFYIPTTDADDFILRSGVSRPRYIEFIKYIARRNNS